MCVCVCLCLIDTEYMRMNEVTQLLASSSSCLSGYLRGFKNVNVNVLHVRIVCRYVNVCLSFYDISNLVSLIRKIL